MSHNGFHTHCDALTFSNHEVQRLNVALGYFTGARGNITHIASAGHYNINEEVIEVEFQGVKKVRQTLEPTLRERLGSYPINVLPAM